MKKILFILFFISGFVWGEGIKISGYVYSSNDNIPLPEANVIVKGTNIGTSTDKNGYFELVNLSLDSKLLISFIGFEVEEIDVKQLENNNLKVFLKRKLLNSQTVLIEGITLTKRERTFTFNVVDKNMIQQNYTFQDIPEFVSLMPSATFYSEGGSGIGYNYLNIRGFDQRRISVTVNGIPQNEPEDHNVYWLDMPDLLSNTELIQIQRGAGSGITGYPSIGGAINIITSNFSDKSFLKLELGNGSYNTRKYSVSASSGLINGNTSYYFSLSNILSSGYRNNSWTNFKSFYFSAVRFDENLTNQINIFGGLVNDGLAYTGLPKFATKDKKQRKVNHNYWEADNKEYFYESYRRPEEREEFFQPHFELLTDYKINENISLNSALFGIIGNGYFDYDGSWADTSYYRLTYNNGFYPNSNPGVSLIRAMVENKQFGWIPRAIIKHHNGELLTGLELRFHNSIHWGSIIYGENLPAGISPNYRYYYYEGQKDIINAFISENYKISEVMNLFAELQASYNSYKIKNERYLNNNFTINNFFLNPRIALSYKINSNINSYLSISNVSREPRLKNYYDAAESSGGAEPQFEKNLDGTYNFSKPLVKPENMTGIELGSNYKSEKLNIDFNLYYMLFKDEIVANGQLDRFGQPITGNMDKTVHAGIELSAVYKTDFGFEIISNFNINKNEIINGKEFYYDSVTGNTYEIVLNNNRIGGFPNVIVNCLINYKLDNFLFNISAKYQGKSYSDNYDNKLKNFLDLYPNFKDYSDNVIDPFMVVNAKINYTKSFERFIKDITFKFQINNVFNKLYVPFAYGKEFFPAAERNYYLGVELRF